MNGFFLGPSDISPNWGARFGPEWGTRPKPGPLPGFLLDPFQSGGRGSPFTGKAPPGWPPPNWFPPGVRPVPSPAFHLDLPFIDPQSQFSLPFTGPQPGLSAADAILRRMFGLR